MRTKQPLIPLIFESEHLTLAEIDFDTWLNLPELELTSGVRGQLTKYRMGAWRDLSSHPGLNFYLNQVMIAQVESNKPEDRVYKVNGSIRKILWESGDLAKPNTLLAQVIKINTQELGLLNHLIYPVNTKAAVKKTVVEIYKELGLSFQSPRLKHGNIVEALNLCLRGKAAHLQDRRTYKDINLKQAIALFKEELILLDELMIDPALFVTGVLAAALIFLSIDKNNLRFFDQLNRQTFKTKDNAHDPVGALIKAIHYLKSASGSQAKIQAELCAKATNCILSFQNGPENDKYWIKQLRNVPFIPYIRQMKAIKGIVGDRAL